MISPSMRQARQAESRAAIPTADRNEASELDYHSPHAFLGTRARPLCRSCPSADIACVSPELMPRSDVMQSEQSKRRDDPHYCEVTANHAVA